MITVLLFSIPVTTFSAVIQNSFTYECVDSNGVYGNCTFDDLIAATVNFIDKITILVLELTVFIIAYAGFQYMTSGGNVSQRASATKMLLSVVKGIAIILCAAVAVTMWIIWAGFQFVLAQGNPGAIDKAKSNLLWSLIGAGILLGAVGISAAVQSTFDALTK